MKTSMKTFATVVSTVLFAGLAQANMNHHDEYGKMDANHDGLVSMAEHDASMAAKFKAADKDGNGILSQGELAGFMEMKGKSGMKAAQKAENKVSEFDTNSDGSISLLEWTDGSKAKFTRMDANKDGALSMDEFDKSMKAY